MRILLTIEYVGANYNGWQSQVSGNTVQQKIEGAICQATGKEVKVIASGRTDSGVHAVAQKAHLDIDTTIPPERFKNAVNVYLPKDIRITKSEEVDGDFHARFSAKQKTYEYKMYLSTTDHPIKDIFAVRLEMAPDIEKMKSCAQLFLGRHDFKGYCASGSSVKDTVREITKSQLIVKGEDIIYRVTGNGFLYNMVRTMVGTMVYVGLNKLTLEEVKKGLDEGDRKFTGKTMPARGLCLQDVVYNTQKTTIKRKCYKNA